VAQEMYDITWHPGMENLADYQSKHHIGLHHVAVQPYYLHQENSPRILPRATRHSTLKGCVGTLENGYVCNVPLPRIPQIQSTNQVALVAGFGTIPIVPFSLLLVSVAH
jgi:hypothetical protein